jgi:hypothetical protein
MAKNADHLHAHSNTFVNHAKSPIPESDVIPNNLTQLNQTNQIPTSINPQLLACELQGYDPSLTKYLVEGFQFGFKLGCEGDPSHSIHRYHKSIFENPVAVESKLLKELNMGRISKPHLHKPFQDFVCSPLGLVPKKTPGEFRIIHDLSFPKDNSVNSHTPTENSTVQYESIENIIHLLQQFGPRALMAKMDIEDDFRNIPVHPSDYHLLGFKWDG